MQRVRHPWRDGIICLGCGQAALSELRIIVGMDQVMNDPGMFRVLFPELFQYAGGLKLFRQACVVRRGVTSSQHRERIKSLHFEIVRIFVAQLLHCFLVGDYPIARPDRTVTRLSNRSCARTVRRIVISVQRGDESALAIRPGLHRHRLFDGSFACAHFVGGRWSPDRMPPSHRDSPLSHCAFRIAFGY